MEKANLMLEQRRLDESAFSWDGKYANEEGGDDSIDEIGGGHSESLRHFDTKRQDIKEMDYDKDYTYFETLSSALDEVRRKASTIGCTLDEDEVFTQFGTGGVSYGQTKSANIGLLKDGNPILGKSGKPLNRALRVVIYRMDSGKYELTVYKTW